MLSKIKYLFNLLFNLFLLFKSLTQSLFFNFPIPYMTQFTSTFIEEVYPSGELAHGCSVANLLGREVHLQIME